MYKRQLKDLPVAAILLIWLCLVIYTTAAVVSEMRQAKEMLTSNSIKAVSYTHLDYGYVKDEKVRDIFGEIKDYKWLVENYTEWFVNDLIQSLYGPDAVSYTHLINGAASRI